MRLTNIICDRFEQHSYRIHVMGDPPLPTDIEPIDFWTASMAENFVNGLHVSPGYWRSLVANCPLKGHDFAHNTFKDTDKGRVSRLMFLGIVKLYPLAHLEGQTCDKPPARFPSLPGVNGTNYTLAPPSMLLTETSPSVKTFTDKQQAARFLADLNLDQAQLNELSTTLGIASPAPTNPTPIKTPQSAQQEKTTGIQTPATITPQIAAMAQALADKQFFLLEQPTKTTPPRRKGPEDLPVEYYTPRPYTLGPHDEPGYVPLRVSKNGTEKCKENHREQKQKKGEREGLVNNNVTFKTQHGAAEHVSKKINSKSISENREYGGMIYQNEDGTYSYTGPIRGSIDGVNPGGLNSVPKGKKPVAYYHTHGGDDPAYDNENFSKIYDPVDKEWYGDIPYADSNKIDGYLATPKGKFKYYSYKNNQVEFLGDL